MECVMEAPNMFTKCTQFGYVYRLPFQDKLPTCLRNTVSLVMYVGYHFKTEHNDLHFCF